MSNNNNGRTKDRRMKVVACKRASLAVTVAEAQQTLHRDAENRCHLFLQNKQISKSMSAVVCYMQSKDILVFHASDRFRHVITIQQYIIDGKYL